MGIVVYESKGSDTRLSGAGHIALVTTELCPAGTAKLRECRNGELPGAVITHYPNIASGYQSSLFVIPIRDHYLAVGSNTSEAPLLSDGASLGQMQMDYWRHYLQKSLPPLSTDEYLALRREEAQFNAGRIFRRAITMQYLFQMLGPHAKHTPTEPIAMVDPQTDRLVPEGRWRDAVGVQYVRSSVIITLPASPSQEQRLLNYVNQLPNTFNALTDNCSDFAASSLKAVFGEAGFRMRARMLDPANAFIRSPISVATSFLSFAKQRKLALHVQSMPMIAGTRRASTPIGSISRGMLFPAARQGKLGMGMRIYFNFLNPLLGLTALGVDEGSRFADLQALVHERGDRSLSLMTEETARNHALRSQYRVPIKREQMEMFGTSSCWKGKQQEFAEIEQQATELGLISREEGSLLLKQDRPYLLARYYEAKSKEAGAQGGVTADVHGCAEPGCESLPAASFIRSNYTRSPALDTQSSGLVPSRSQVREMAASESSDLKATAFRLMTTVINYDLSSEEIERRLAWSFDPDWQLFLEVAQNNALGVPQTSPSHEGVQACSIREFETGTARTDAYQDAQSLKGRLAREARGLLYSPSR